ncbi:Rpp14/Pop5 family protein [Stygiolobus caldivivus]|uniref:Ribonuclease P protein component 2 n=1 Tax=Stygiolobus caldivivus TaxID=2824673 RepID=A0A8D5ZG26_9CREN|nr:Rpp14/Pop5 family protein [Stygiolobus caldivivus]BCU70618.1 ribonuclease P [Stygiolobus caldivivus]
MMLQIFIDLIIFAWLIILSFYVLKARIIYFKKIKAKKNIRVKRYIIFEMIPKAYTQPELELAIRDAVRELGGKIWLEISNPKVILVYQNYGVISTTRAGYKAVIASLPLVKRINGEEVLLVPRRTTGSLKKAKRLIGIR